jgi:hypothetical protein
MSIVTFVFHAVKHELRRHYAMSVIIHQSYCFDSIEIVFWMSIPNCLILFPSSTTGRLREMRNKAVVCFQYIDFVSKVVCVFYINISALWLIK